MKRDYIGGEPTYKRVERLQKMQEDEAMEKWRQEQINVNQAQTFVEQPKDNTYIQTSHPMYVSDVTGIIQQPVIGK